MTREFRSYRDLARLIWNVFLSRYEDQEDLFLDIDPAIFHAFLESKIDAVLKEDTTPYDTRFFSELAVRSPRPDALRLRRMPDMNDWQRTTVPENAALRYVRLFDFESFTGTDRDFEYVHCVCLDRCYEDQTQYDEFLVKASDVEISYANDEP